MSFWQSGTGQMITGDKDKAFLPDFDVVIPNNTRELAKIKTFELVDETQSHSGLKMKFYKIVWKLSEGFYANREVTQKIRCFDGKPESIDRHLHMLKLIFMLANFKPSHNEAPTTDELRALVGRQLGINIREFSVPKPDGTTIDGNFVSEVHPVTGFVREIGQKMEPIEKHAPIDSALMRNSRQSHTSNSMHSIPTSPGSGHYQPMEQDIPF